MPIQSAVSTPPQKDGQRSSHALRGVFSNRVPRGICLTGRSLEALEVKNRWTRTSSRLKTVLRHRWSGSITADYVHVTASVVSRAPLLSKDNESIG